MILMFSVGSLKWIDAQNTTAVFFLSRQSKSAETIGRLKDKLISRELICSYLKNE